ncbi:MAG: pyrimidine 5'-nucleotidase [Tahibacter sp.]
MKYPWILFDADDTLFHFDAYAGLQRMFSRYTVDFDDQAYAQYQVLNKPLWVEYQDGRITAQQLQERRFAPWSERVGVPAQRLNREFFDAMADICTFLPGAGELISRLAPLVKLGLITNGFTQLQTVRLQRMGVFDVFDPVVISEQVGVAKPDVAIFEHALARMGSPPRDQVLMVGDNLLTDIQGGLNAGIHTCWMNLRGDESVDGVLPHHEVRSLAELQRWLMT